VIGVLAQFLITGRDLRAILGHFDAPHYFRGAREFQSVVARPFGPNLQQ
jgi:hypothetical protein